MFARHHLSVAVAAMLGFVVAFLLHGPAHADTDTPVVVELFTSQGCNSCPPADALLGELASEDNVIGLSFHVDYWDYIGWKDTFASRATSQRQRAYGQVLGQRYVYTPQIVVGGRMQAVGSDRHAVRRAMEYVEHHGERIKLNVAQGHGDALFVHLPKTTLESPAWIWLVRFDDKHTVEIKRGENHGKSLTYHNVVRDVERIGVWDGRSMSIPLDIATMQANGRDGCAILVQSDGFGPIIAATRISFDDF